MSIQIENNGEKKRTRTKKKTKRGLSFYAAVILCVGAAALSVLVNRTDASRSSGTQPPADQSTALPFDQFPSVDETLLDSSPVLETTPSQTDVRPAAVTTSPDPTTVASQMNVTQPTTIPTDAVPASADIRFRMPTGGSVVSGYSGDELVFCATMCDWRVHNGIDISGTAGEEVLACAGGIVEGFAADILYGNTAIIRLPDDSVMYYCGLSDTQMVSAGLQVNAGDVIGYIGEVPSELEDGPHIHLAMIKDGKFIDPAPLLSGR